MISNTDNSTPRFTSLVSILCGVIQTECLKVCINLEISQHLLNGPKSCLELSRLLNVDQGYLYRVLRLMSSLGIYEEHDNQVFSNNELSTDLIKYDGFCRFMTDGLFMNSFTKIGEALVKGGFDTPIEFANRSDSITSFYEYVEKNPNFKDLLHSGMESLNSFHFDCIVKEISFDQFETVIDIGGSQGHLLLKILEKNHSIKKGINFDQSSVIEKNKKMLVEKRKLYSNQVLDRFEEVGGSFFEKVPTGDVYVIRNVLHNWYDHQVEKIFETITKAMKPTSKIYIIESIVKSKNVPSNAVFLDMYMMVAVGGSERRIEEFTKLGEKYQLQFEREFNISSGITCLVLSK
eukprot:gene6048-7533_t